VVAPDVHVARPMQGAAVPACELRDLELSAGDRSLLRVSELRIPDRAVTVLLGPSGTGKSTLLRAVAGQEARNVRRSGEIRLFGTPRDGSSEEVALIPQPSRSEPPKSAADLFETFAGSRLVLLDEIDRTTTEPSEELARSIRAEAEERAVLLVTHDLAFARLVAHHAVLICAGNVVADGAAPSFFERPPNELTATFLRQGNCWPAPTMPALPSHFSWVREEILAGMGRPGLLADVDEDLSAIALAGVSMLVTLTEESFPASKLRSFGIHGRHFPIRDMGVPAVGPTIALCRDLERGLRNGERIAVHCAAGLGRTGLILAAMAISRDRIPADAACAAIRALRPGSIQNAAQERFLVDFAEAFGIA
jgi:atypical dual specificity phosphatase